MEQCTNLPGLNGYVPCDESLVPPPTADSYVAIATLNDLHYAGIAGGTVTVAARGGPVAV